MPGSSACWRPPDRIEVLYLNSMTTVAIVVVLGCAFAQLLCVIWRNAGADDSRPDSDDSQPDSDDWGGGNKRREPPGPQDSGGGEPPWWPDFERHFVDYVRGLEVAPTPDR